MKQHARVAGVDDAAFAFSDERTEIIAVVARLPGYMEGVLKGEVTVDGTDATQVVGDIFESSRYLEGLHLIVLDGTALGGFNVVDLEALHERLGKPVASVTREQPDMAAIEAALRGHFEDWKSRLAVMTKLPLRSLDTDHKPIWVQSVGAPDRDVNELIRKSIVRGAIPEPLRMAHLIASGISKGQSSGRA